MQQPSTKKPNQGNYAFIDSQNLNLGIQSLGWKMDWRKFRKFLETRYQVSKAFMFIGYVPENEAMYTQLFESGYLIVLKPTVEVHHHDEPAAEGHDQPEKKPQIKGNIDTELVLYALKDINDYHKAVIVSGDGDFYSLVEYLIDRQKLQAVLAPNQRYSSLLKQFSDHVQTLDGLKRELSYRPARKA